MAAVADNSNTPVVVADDITGAAESAIALGPGTPVMLDATSITDIDGAFVVDTASRLRSSEEAASRAAMVTAAAFAQGRRIVIKKVDSLLRGHIPAEITAISALGHPVVLSPALPALHRTVRGGVLHVDGAPLSDGDSWRYERTPPPSTLAEHFADLDPVIISSADLAHDSAPELLRRLAADGRLAIADAETDADLAAVRTASARAFADRPYVLAGSAALVPRSAAPRMIVSASAATRALIVVGSAESKARQQADALIAAGAGEQVLSVDALLSGSVDVHSLVRSIEGTGTETIVLTLSAESYRPEAASAVAESVAEIVAAAIADDTTWALGAVGGQTARAILERLGIRRLVVEAATGYGTIVAHADDRTVGLRPGSFGSRDSLVRLNTALLTTGVATQHQKLL